jgi:hypothetical protein
MPLADHSSAAAGSTLSPRACSSPRGVTDAMTATGDASHAVVVMAYGDSPFLGDCLGSLRAQSVASELLVTTSTPSPYVDEVAAGHGATVRVNGEKGGIAADWNFALTATDARRVTLAHQDDLYFPRFAERSLALLDERPDAAACFTGYEQIADDGRVTSSRLSRVKHLLDRFILGRTRVVSPARMRAFLSLGNPLPCSSMTFNRDRLGEFRFSNAYRSNLDWDAWLRLAQRGEVFVRAPEALVGRRHNALTETSRLIRDGVRQREDLAMFRRLWPSPLAEMIAFAYRSSY